MERQRKGRAGMQQVLPPARSGWKFSKRAVSGRGMVRVGLKTRPCVFALNRASMRDSPSELTHAKKIESILRYRWWQHLLHPCP